MIYPSSGTGAWEAALVNTLSPGDRVLAFETGHFATLWQAMAGALGLEVDLVPGDWRHGVDPDVVEERLTADTGHAIKAVCVVHNETSTGVTSRVAEIRAGHRRAPVTRRCCSSTPSPRSARSTTATTSGASTSRSRGSQKGLMLPPGLGFNAVSDKALAASRTAGLPRSYWDWEPILEANAAASGPTRPATNLLYGLREALRMLDEEGLPQVFARHQRHAEATRAAVRGWGLEVLCADEREHSGSLTAILLPDGHDADEVRRIILERYDMSLGAGLGKLAGKVFRIGHLGHFNDLTLAGTLVRGADGPAAGRRADRRRRRSRPP